uniref:Fibronectin type-III domain-containing protein n=1 Tax=Hippocampus comes TaxID=109280 RepID=A0A3Q2Y6A5_HIPCM
KSLWICHVVFHDVSVFPSAPSVPPQDVRLLSLSSTSIQVSWAAPPAATGTYDDATAVTGYSLTYHALAREDAQRHQVLAIGADVRSFVLEGLEKWTEYTVWVRALTDVGPGPASPPVRVRTQEDGTWTEGSHLKGRRPCYDLSALACVWTRSVVTLRSHGQFVLFLGARASSLMATDLI